jgi:hypothetical protein
VGQLPDFQEITICLNFDAVSPKDKAKGAETCRGICGKESFLAFWVRLRLRQMIQLQELSESSRPVFTTSGNFPADSRKLLVQSKTSKTAEAIYHWEH